MIFSTIQMNSQDDKKNNIIQAEKFIDQAADKGAKVVLLPEMFNFLGPDERKHDNAEKIPGPTIKKMANKADEHKLYVVCGSILEKVDENDRLFNTSVLLNPDGEIISKYRKIHLFDVDIEGQPTYKESSIIKPGKKVVTIDTEIATFGFTICYDLRFPELYRRLAKKGAEIVFLPAAFTLYTGKDHWEPLLRARAIENQIYLIASAQIGPHPPDKKCYGKSMIVDPWGSVISKAPDRPCIVQSDIDMNYQKKVRKELPSLDHINEEVFTI